MKNISKSVAMIAAVAAIAIGGTVAYFSDTETSTGNTLTAGTIDIAIDSHNPFTGYYNVGDLKPGETGNMIFKVKNVGTNPANISKSLYNFTKNDSGEGYNCHDANSNWNYSASSEPECVAENGTRVDNVETQLFYGLEVKVYANDTEANPIWWQTIYKVGDNQTLTNVYESNHTTATKYVNLGVVPPNGHMTVTQVYKFNPDAGNQYQGDGLKFDMEIRADQLAQNTNGQAMIAMENKGGAPDWAINYVDSINGTLTYGTTGDKFDFSFSATTASNQAYTLIYVGGDGNYPADSSIKLGEASGTTLSFSGNVETGNIVNGKVWLIPTADYDSGNTIMTGWHNDQNLYETGLINYTKN